VTPDKLIPNFSRERIYQARDFAVLAHGDQEYGSQPYIVHLDAVLKIVTDQESDPLSFDAAQRAIIALLHDTIEDTDATVKMLKRAFGSHVARQVDLVSDKPAHNRKARKRAAMDVLGDLGPSDYDALIIKAADRLANVRAAAKDKPGLLKMYQKEHRAFTHAACRTGLVDPIWDELNTLLAPDGQNKGVEVS